MSTLNTSVKGNIKVHVYINTVRVVKYYVQHKITALVVLYTVKLIPIKDIFRDKKFVPRWEKKTLNKGYTPTFG